MLKVREIFCCDLSNVVGKHNRNDLQIEDSIAGGFVF